MYNIVNQKQQLSYSSLDTLVQYHHRSYHAHSVTDNVERWPNEFRGDSERILKVLSPKEKNVVCNVKVESVPGVSEVRDVRVTEEDNLRRGEKMITNQIVYQFIDRD